MRNEEKRQIAETILEQLGGREFVVMTGAKHLSFGSSGELSFKLPIGKYRICRIELTPMDVYRVTFFKSLTDNGVIHDDVYCDVLRGLFERETGLRTSLWRVYA